jgi:CRP/FNR family transcriptional regulator, anaerobic regulatory protein
MVQIHVLPRQNAAPSPCSTCTARSLTICASLTPDDQAKMASHVTTVTLQPGQTLFSEGDAAEHVFNITSGSMSVAKSMPDGRRQIAGFPGAGDFLGASTRADYTVSAEALTETHLCRFQQSVFRRLLSDMPCLEQRLLAVAENEIAAVQEQILLLGRKTAMERIASFLLLQASRMKARGMSDNPVLLPMTRAEVGDYLGLTIETVSRCFSRLRKLDVIGLPAPGRVQIRQVEQLRTLSEAA